MSRLLALALLSTPLAWISSGCGGAPVRAGLDVAPSLATARLGGVTSALTFGGDWMGGVPSPEDLGADLELASRRGVEVVLDLRTLALREDQPLGSLVRDAGMELVEVNLRAVGEELQEFPFEISNKAIDNVRDYLRTPGRSRVLVLDDDGRLGAMVYAIHLELDRGVALEDSLRAARATGITSEDARFMRAQLKRIRAVERRTGG